MKKFLLFLAVLFSTTFASASPGTLTLEAKNTVVLRGEVNSGSVSSAISKILLSKENTVYLYLQSPGGSIFAGLELIDVIKNSGKHVVCVADFAASMAFMILQSCHERYVTNYGVLMQHVASYGLRGDEPNNFKMAVFLRKLIVKLNQEQADRMGMSVKDFYSKVRDDWWMMGDEGVTNRAADGVVNVKCSQDLIDKRENVAVPVLFFVVNVTFSGCPLISQPVAPPETKATLNQKQQQAANKELLKLDPKSNMNKLFKSKKGK